MKKWKKTRQVEAKTETVDLNAKLYYSDTGNLRFSMIVMMAEGEMPENADVDVAAALTFSERAAFNASLAKLRRAALVSAGYTEAESVLEPR